MTTKIWEETIKIRPPTKKENVESHPWTAALQELLAKVRHPTVGPVKAFITLYINEQNPDKDGDLDNYAKTILDELQPHVLRDDKDIDELVVRRIKWNKNDKMTIRLEWSTA